jgi:hypothetical protein
MTMDNPQDDRLLATVASLRTHDVSLRHTRALRSRCHAVLRTRSRRNPPTAANMAFRRVIGPVLGSAWCLAYLVEIIRRAAALYGF